MNRKTDSCIIIQKQPRYNWDWHFESTVGSHFDSLHIINSITAVILTTLLIFTWHEERLKASRGVQLMIIQLLVLFERKPWDCIVTVTTLVLDRTFIVTVVDSDV